MFGGNQEEPQTLNIAEMILKKIKEKEAMTTGQTADEMIRSRLSSKVIEAYSV